MRIELKVSEDQAGQRVDRALSALPEVGSRSRAARLIEAGAVLVDGRPAAKSAALELGATIVVDSPEPASASESEPALAFAIVFQDDSLLVVDKPAGLVVHPGPGNRTGTLSQALAGLSGGGDPARPGIVHRLDKETSGLLVVARNDSVLRDLQAALQRREIGRRYTALVKGRPDSPSGTIDAALGRDRRNPENIAIRADSTRPAITHFDTLEELGSRTLLGVTLETGRTHQIRVHLAAIGLPVSGDRQYGVAGDLGLSRQFLHAAELSFAHPETGEQLNFSSPLPGDLARALDVARGER